MHTRCIQWLVVFGVLTTICWTSSPVKISLNTSNVFDLFGIDQFHFPAQHLLDEQILSGDPLNNPNSAGKPITYYLPEYNDDWFPINRPNMPGPSVVIDLNDIYLLTNIFLFINTGNFNITWQFSETNPFEPQLNNQITTKIDYSFGSNQWNNLNLTNKNINTRYITLILYNSPMTSLIELIFYGIFQGGNSKSDELLLTQKQFGNNKNTNKKIKMGMLMGTNGFGWTPINNLTNVVGAVREYQAWSWSEGGESTNYPGYPNNENRFQCAAQGGFCYDYVLSNVSNSIPSLNWHHDLLDTPLWLHNYNQTKQNWLPVNNSIFNIKNGTINPHNYNIVADHCWQVTARYGRQQWDKSLLKLAPNISMWDATPQPQSSGLNRLNWFEVYNEPNAWWEGRNGFMSGIEHSAMQSATYDGHCNSMSNTMGIKNADITMNVSVSGLVNMSLIDRWQTMKWWSLSNRKQCNNTINYFPAEAINAHYYAQNNDNTQGISPEDYNVYSNILSLTKWRDNELPNIELWITEYGYDSESSSPYGCPSIGNYSNEQIQGIWIIRTILAMSATGINRAHQFMWADTATGSSGSYATSGLVTQKYQIKQSYYYWTCMFYVLKDYYFINRNCTYQSKQICIHIYQNDQNQLVYVVWATTSSDMKFTNFKLQINGTNSKNNVMVYQPTVGIVNCTVSTLSVSNGVVVLNQVRESPVFVLN